MKKILVFFSSLISIYSFAGYQYTPAEINNYKTHFTALNKNLGAGIFKL